MNFASCQEEAGWGGRSVRYGAVYCDVTRAVPTALFSHSEPIFVDVRTGRKVLAPRVSSADCASTERIPTGAVNTNLSLLLPSFFFFFISRLRTPSARVSWRK